MKNKDRLNELLDEISKQLEETFGKDSAFFLYLSEPKGASLIGHTELYRQDLVRIRKYAHETLKSTIQIKPSEPNAHSDND